MKNLNEIDEDKYWEISEWRQKYYDRFLLIVVIISITLLILILIIGGFPLP